MPKVVDHGARRDEIASATIRLVTRQGVDSVSIRRVADEAGWTAGLIGYYFKDRAVLLRHVATHLLDSIPKRLAALLSGAATGSGLGIQLVEELLPLTPERISEAAAWVALSAGIEDEEIARTADLGWVGTRRVTRIAVLAARGDDVTASGDWTTFDDELAEPQLESIAHRLHQLVDAATLQAAITPGRLDPAVLREELRQLITGVAPARYTG